MNNVNLAINELGGSVSADSFAKTHTLLVRQDYQEAHAIDELNQSLAYDLARLAMFKAAVRISDNDWQSKQEVSVALGLLGVHRSLLFDNPRWMLRYIEFQQFMGNVASLRGEIDLGNCRVAGCGNVFEESEQFLQAIPNSENTSAQPTIRARLREWATSNFHDQLVSELTRGVTSRPRNLASDMVTITPLKHQIIHFYDQYWDPDQDISLAEMSQRGKRHSMRPDIARHLSPQLFGVNPSDRLFFDKKVAEIEELPKDGAFYTQDSHQSIRMLERPVDSLLALRFEPESISSGVNPANLLEMKQYFTLLGINLLGQLKPDGLFVMSVGKGNSEQESIIRLMTVKILAEAAKQSQVPYVYTENQNLYPPALTSVGSGYDVRANHGMFACYVPADFQASIMRTVLNEVSPAFRRILSESTMQASKLWRNKQ